MPAPDMHTTPPSYIHTHTPLILRTHFNRACSVSARPPARCMPDEWVLPASAALACAALLCCCYCLRRRRSIVDSVLVSLQMA